MSRPPPRAERTNDHVAPDRPGMQVRPMSRSSSHFGQMCRWRRSWLSLRGGAGNDKRRMASAPSNVKMRTAECRGLHYFRPSQVSSGFGPVNAANLARTRCLIASRLAGTAPARGERWPKARCLSALRCPGSSSSRSGNGPRSPYVFPRGITRLAHQRCRGAA
jgi:hypothetical protein